MTGGYYGRVYTIFRNNIEFVVLRTCYYGSNLSYKNI